MLTEQFDAALVAFHLEIDEFASLAGVAGFWCHITEDGRCEVRPDDPLARTGMLIQHFADLLVLSGAVASDDSADFAARFREWVACRPDEGADAEGDAIIE